MSIAYGGIVAFFFRGLNVVLAFGTVLLTSRAMRQEDYGLFVLGLSVIGFIGAITGGMTAATAYQVSNQRRAPGVALANAGATSAGLSILALVGGLLGATRPPPSASPANRTWLLPWSMRISQVPSPRGKGVPLPLPRRDALMQTCPQV